LVMLLTTNGGGGGGGDDDDAGKTAVERSRAETRLSRVVTIYHEQR